MSDANLVWCFFGGLVGGVIATLAAMAVIEGRREQARARAVARLDRATDLVAASLRWDDQSRWSGGDPSGARFTGGAPDGEVHG